MDTVEVKTSEMIGLALNWSVAVSLNGSKEFFNVFGARMLGRSITNEVMDGEINPSQGWGQIGSLIESHVTTLCSPRDGYWWAHSRGVIGERLGDGNTALIAVCRAIVAANLGETVSIPAELLK